MSYTLVRAVAAAPLTIEHGVVRWAGRSDPEDDAPILAFECTLDPLEEVGDLVAKYPMPAALVAALAERFVDVSLDAGDPRWRRALAAARIARGARATEVGEGALTVYAPGPASSARVESDGTIVVISDDRVTVGDRVMYTPPAGWNAQCSVAHSTEPASDQVLVVAHDYSSNRFEVRAFDRTTGAQAGRSAGVIAGGVGTPAAFSPAKGGWWLHSGGMHLRVAAAGAITTITGYDHWGVVGRWLLVYAGGTEWRWHDLDGVAPVRTLALPKDTRLQVAPDAIWAGAPGVLYRIAAGEQPTVILEGPVYTAFAIDGDRVWSRQGDAVVALAPSIVERWRRVVPHIAARILRVGAYLAVLGFEQASVLDDAGEIVVTLAKRREGGARALADGTVALSSGEHVAIVAPDGVVTHLMPLPYDGWIAGATAERFIFGPTPSSQLAPDAYYALDRTGAITARLPFVANRNLWFAGCAGDLAYFIRDGEVIAWDPRGVGDVIAVVAPPERLAAERGEQRMGPEVINHRDDRPDIGIEVRQRDQLLVDGTYGGSPGPGYLGEVPFRVSDGAIVTFYRCDLRVGHREGEVVTRGATAILVECRVPANVAWTASADSHLVMLDCMS